MLEAETPDEEDAGPVEGDLAPGAPVTRIRGKQTLKYAAYEKIAKACCPAGRGVLRTVLRTSSTFYLSTVGTVQCI